MTRPSLSSPDEKYEYEPALTVSVERSLLGLLELLRRLLELLERLRLRALTVSVERSLIGLLELFRRLELLLRALAIVLVPPSPAPAGSDRARLDGASE